MSKSKTQTANFFYFSQSLISSLFVASVPLFPGTADKEVILTPNRRQVLGKTFQLGQFTACSPTVIPQ